MDKRAKKSKEAKRPTKPTKSISTKYSRKDRILKELDSESDDKEFDSAEEKEFSACHHSWSPNGAYLAVAVKHRIFVRDSKNLRVQVAFTVTGGWSIDLLQWSPDSLFIAAVSYSHAAVSIRRVDDIEWKCLIELGDDDVGVGLIDFEWSPDARHVLTTSTFYTQLTVWSLSKSLVSSFNHICQTPRFKSFTSEGKFLALAHYDVDFNYSISIYESYEWNLKETFPISTKDFNGVAWSPGGSHLAVWDSPLFCNLFIYTAAGQLIKHYSPDGLSLGLEEVKWSPSGQLLAMKNCTNTFRLLNACTFGLLLEEDMDLSFRPSSLLLDCEILHETITEKDEEIRHIYESGYTWLLNGTCSETNTIESALIADESVKFSYDGDLVACVGQKYKNILWIWNLEQAKLTNVLIHLNSITDFQWDPNGSRLTICTGGNCIYFWTPAKAYAKNIKNFTRDRLSFPSAHRICWNPVGTSFIVQDCCSDKIVVGYLKHFVVDECD